MNTKTNGSPVWPYIVVGSAIGGAIGYLFLTESGRKVRRVATHPDELADSIEHAGNFLERKAKVVSDRLHGIIARAKQSIEEGERMYQEAGEYYRSRARKVENKNDQIASNIHDRVDRMNQTALSVEQSVLDPVAEVGALVRGVIHGVKRMIGKEGRPRLHERPISLQRDRHFD